LWQQISSRHVWRLLFSRQNVWALVLCLVIILVIIFTTDSAPLWIYQGF
jgi:hypothetical protein